MSKEVSILSSKQKRMVLLFACLCGFAFSSNYINHTPLKSWLMASFNTPSYPFTKAVAVSIPENLCVTVQAALKDS